MWLPLNCKADQCSNPRWTPALCGIDMRGACARARPPIVVHQIRCCQRLHVLRRPQRATALGRRTGAARISRPVPQVVALGGARGQHARGLLGSSRVVPAHSSSAPSARNRPQSRAGGVLRGGTPPARFHSSLGAGVLFCMRARAPGACQRCPRDVGFPLAMCQG